MASATSAYSFTDEEVSHLANCNDQEEFLHVFRCSHRFTEAYGLDYLQKEAYLQEWKVFFRGALPSVWGFSFILGVSLS